MVSAKNVRQEEINKALWNACDMLRGVAEPYEYTDCIVAMLFIKYISDIRRDRIEQLQQEYGSDRQRIQHEPNQERFVIPDGADFYELYKQRDAPRLGELINEVLRDIEVANQNDLSGVLHDIDFSARANHSNLKEHDQRLRDFLRDFNLIDLRPSRADFDVAGNACIYLLEKLAVAARKKAGVFLTPVQVSALMAKLAEPETGDLIYDPVCGSGSLLIKAASEVSDQDCLLFGQEANHSTWAIAKMNMFLHNQDDADIKCGNTLNDPALIEEDSLMKFNLVVANPPFSPRWDADKFKGIGDKYKRFRRGIPPKAKGDYAFISHAIESALPKKGRVVITAPHGVLFRSASEGKIRESIINENLLKAVIGLPSNLFPGTNIPVVILVFDRKRESSTEPNDNQVMFIDASQAFKSVKAKNRLENRDVQKIFDTYSAWKNVDKYARVVEIEEIIENDYNLSIPRYVDTFKEEEIDLTEVQAEIEALEARLGQVRQRICSDLEMLGAEV